MVTAHRVEGKKFVVVVYSLFKEIVFNFSFKSKAQGFPCIT